MKRQTWTEEEVKILIELYPDLQGKEIALKLGKPLTSIYHKSNQLKLRKSEAFKQSPLSGGFIKGSTAGRSFRFKKGHIPMNKGKKMTDYVKDPNVISKIMNTTFKKGNLPKNTLTDGAIRTRKDKTGRNYKWIRISLGKWEQLHVHIYKKHHGSIPENKIIVFDDGDSMNFNIENLIAITQAEHMERSRNSDGVIAKYLSGRDEKFRQKLLKYPELLDLKRQQINLKKQINGKL